MGFGDRMAMGEGVAANLSCGHPHVDQTLTTEVLVAPPVTCPLCGRLVTGSLRELPQEEKSNE
jgi:hypothetical protein